MNDQPVWWPTHSPAPEHVMCLMWIGRARCMLPGAHPATTTCLPPPESYPPLVITDADMDVLDDMLWGDS